MNATASKSKPKTASKPKSSTTAKPSARKPSSRSTNGASASRPAPSRSPSQAPSPASNGASAAVPAPAERHQNEGHGRRLTLAFEALEAFPALAESRDRLISVVSKEHVATADVVAAVELLTPQTVQGLAGRLRTFDFFERSSVWEAAPERFRLHALATQHAADRIAAEVGFEHRDRLTATSLLHDIGKLVLLHAYPGYPSQVHRGARTPEERIHQERRELGVDHALVGGVLARRWGLPKAVASVIERHHAPDADGEAAFIRLADMLAHYEQGAPVSPAEMLRTARSVGLGPDELRRVMYELPSSPSQRRRHIDPCPLSGRELGVLQRLAEGKVYKQIAHELTLSTSTVRTHLHNIYGKLGAVDRAQAVLIATERGWL